MLGTKILVTGGTGFLGSEIVKMLIQARDYAITVLDVNPPSLGTESYSTVNYVRCNIMQPRELREVFKKVRPTVVVHTVAVNLLGAARYGTKGEGEAFAVNVDGTRNVIEASQEYGAKALVYTSSVTVLMDQLEEDFKNADETWSTGRAITIYGQSKTAAESLVLSSNTSKFRTCALRSAPIFGPGDPVTIPTLHGCINNGETPFILGSGTNLQDYVFVSNVADAHVLAVRNLLGSGTAAGEAFFITNGEPVPVRDLCVAVWKEFDHFPPFEIRVPQRLAWWMGWAMEWMTWATGTKGTLSRGVIMDATKTRYASIVKAKKVLGYEPRVSLPEAVKVSCQHFKQQLSDRTNL